MVEERLLRAVKSAACARRLDSFAFMRRQALFSLGLRQPLSMLEHGPAAVVMTMR